MNRNKLLITKSIVGLILTLGLQSNCSSAIVKSIDSEGLTDLTAALDAGEDPNEFSYFWGRTPLHYAIQEGKPEAVKLLLEKGADPNGGDSKSRVEPPIHLAATWGDLASIQYLLAKGADPHLSTFEKAEEQRKLGRGNVLTFKDYKSAFNNAAFSYNRILNFEQDKNPLPKDRDSYEMKRLLANKENLKEIINIFFARKGLTSRDMLATYWAFQHEDNAFMNDMGVKVLQKSSPKDWHYELWISISQRGTVDQLKAAISRAKPPLREETGTNILQDYFLNLPSSGGLCTYCGQLSADQKLEHDKKYLDEYNIHKQKISLLTKVVSITAKDKESKSLGHYAMKRIFSDMSRFSPESYMAMALKDFRIDMNAKDNFGWTALHYEVVSNKSDALTFLWKEMKADPNIKAFKYPNKPNSIYPQLNWSKGISPKELRKQIYMRYNLNDEMKW